MNTLVYLLFLGFSVILYYSIPGKYQKHLLFITSLVYIGSISVSFLIFAFVFSAINYFFGILIETQKTYPLRKTIYRIALFLDIGFLIFFKYTNFFIANYNSIVENWSDKDIVPMANILMPIGISYYTFQCIGYLYRVFKKLEVAEHGFYIFFIYTLFFPKILSGPIEKSNHFLPQLHQSKIFLQDNFTMGLRMILFGLFKKIVIGDNIGVLISSVYGDITNYSGSIFVVVFLLQTVALYFDFSGYTDIALGSGKLLGFELTNNFKRPFFSPNVATFWRRWHISLTSWCNEYIFMPTLYKRRGWGQLGSVYAVFITFIVIGFWHGPRWNFLLIGILQGIAINYEFLTRRMRIKIASFFPKKMILIFSIIITYIFISFSHIFFYASTFSEALYFLNNLFFNFHVNSDNFNLVLNFNFIIATLFSILLLWLESLEEKGLRLFQKINSIKPWLRWLIYYVMIYFILLLSLGHNEFIYENF